MQKLRGFKSYRELYNKKITEQENLGEMLRNTQKDVKVLYIFSVIEIYIYNFIFNCLIKNNVNK